MRDAILTLLSKTNEHLPAEDIATITGLDLHDEVLPALHRFQDENRVYLKCGLYWLQEWQRKEMADA